MKTSHAIEIHNTPEKVFHWLNNPERAMTWMSSVTKTEILNETPDMVGTTFREIVAENGQGTELHGVITALLDSWWTFVPAVFLTIVLIIRTAWEDRTLQDELVGYRKYAGRVRYRLLPGVW